jgi:hypothetical protein
MSSNKTVLVTDGGLFQPLAHLLAEHFERVLYFREWRNGPFPTPMDMKIGKGYEDITRVDSIMGHINEVDLFVFSDLFYAEEQEYLRALGKSVFGAGNGEEMELWREDFKDQMKQLGMPVIPHEMVTGITALREYLKKHDNVYVKVSFVRGLKETFFSQRYDLSKPDIDAIEDKLGVFSEEQEFMVEKKTECVREDGSDQIIAGGKFPKTVQFSVEGKDKTALTRMVKATDLPKGVRKVNDWIQPLLEEYDYCGYFCTEIREGEDGKPYLIDPCCRHPSPAGEPYNLLCRNIGAIIEAASEGEIEEPDFEDAFAAQAIMSADMATTTSVPIWIPPKYRRNVALYNSAIMEDGQEVVVLTRDPKAPEIGSVVGTGKTIDAAIKQCEDIAKQIECAHLGIYTDKLQDAKKLLTL